MMYAGLLNVPIVVISAPALGTVGAGPQAKDLKCCAIKLPGQRKARNMKRLQYSWALSQRNPLQLVIASDV